MHTQPNTMVSRRATKPGPIPAPDIELVDPPHWLTILVKRIASR